MMPWPERLSGLSRTLDALKIRKDAPFKRPDELVEALTHASFASKKGIKHNERLEMLGDAVVGFLVADLLFNELTGESEGVLTRARATLVDEQGLAQRARTLELGRWLALGKGASLEGEAERTSVLADAFEAVVAGLYRSEGLEVARRLVKVLFASEASGLAHRPAPRDYKTFLQEYVQAQWKLVPLYEIVSTEGPDHDRTFCAEVRLEGRTVGRGVGATKKAAQQEAAKVALESFDQAVP